MSEKSISRWAVAGAIIGGLCAIRGGRGRYTSSSQKLARLFKIIGPAVAVFALVISYLDFKETTINNTEARVAGLLQAHYKLGIEHPELSKMGATLKDTAKITPRYENYANHALFTAETIFRLLGDDPSWKDTSKWLIKSHPLYAEVVTNDSATARTYAIEFLGFMQQVLQDSASSK